MSVSINNYINKNYIYDITDSGSTTTSTSSSGSSRAKKGSEIDSVDFSQLAMQFFNQGTNSIDNEDISTTDTYSPSMMRPAPPPLTTNDMKSFLLKSEEATASGTDSTLKTLQDLLKDYDFSSVSDDEISASFQIGAGLATDDIQTLLKNLQSKLSLVTTGDETSEQADNPMAVVKQMLSQVDLSSTTDEEMNSLFNNVLGIIGQDPQSRTTIAPY